MRWLTMATTTLVALQLSTPATANWTLKGKWTCHESATGTSKLPTAKAGSEYPIAACLGVALTDPDVDDYSLVFDSDTSRLLVVRNCDTSITCILTESHTCADATDENASGFKTNGVCLYRMIDFDEAEAEGEMACKESESYSVDTNKFKFKASCNGMLSLNGLPCTFKFKTGKLFEETGSCPATP